jgi:hypothetical protein
MSGKWPSQGRSSNADVVAPRSAGKITIDTREKPRTFQVALVVPQAAARAERKSNGMMTVCQRRGAGPTAAR